MRTDFSVHLRLFSPPNVNNMADDEQNLMTSWVNFQDHSAIMHEITIRDDDFDLSDEEDDRDFESDAEDDIGDAEIDQPSVTLPLSQSKGRVTIAKEDRKHYICPECDKTLLTPGGFKGHVSKQHSRPDIQGKSIPCDVIAKGPCTICAYLW